MAKHFHQTLEELWPAFAAVKTEFSKWGDEVEYLVLHIDHKARELRPSPRSLEILHTLKSQYPDRPFDAEAFKYMLESQPQRPYGNSLRDLARVENDMRHRYVDLYVHQALSLIQETQTTDDRKFIVQRRASPNLDQYRNAGLFATEDEHKGTGHR